MFQRQWIDHPSPSAGASGLFQHLLLGCQIWCCWHMSLARHHSTRRLNSQLGNASGGRSRLTCLYLWRSGTTHAMSTNALPTQKLMPGASCTVAQLTRAFHEHTGAGRQHLGLENFSRLAGGTSCR